MSYFGVSLRNGVGLGLGTVPSLTNTPLSYRLAPSLDLSFAGSDTLSPAITFSRTTNATLTNSAGLVANAPMNLLTFSEQFDNAAWGKTAGTVTANTSTAPDGTITADQIASTGAGVFRASISVSQGFLHTASVYAKYVSGAGNFLFGFDAGPASGRASFNLQTGVVVSSEANVVSSSITAVGDGWYRCVVSAITTSTTCILVYYNATSGANWLVWGAQLNIGALQPYNPTTVKNLLGFTEHFDNAAWTKSNSFIQTNQIRNNTGQGAVVGTPGTLPTNWGESSIGLTRTVVGTGIENGINYIDVRFSGTTTGQFGSITFEPSNAVAASASQAWTNSLYASLVAGSLTNVSQVGSALYYFNASNTFISVTAPPTTLSSTLTRSSTTGTTPATTAFVQPGFYFNMSAASGQAVDFTLRIGMPQLVQGATAGDVVATYAAAAAVGYTDIYGQPFAQKLVENTANTSHYVENSAVTTTSGTVYRASWYAKAAERSFVSVYLVDSGIVANTSSVFNLSTGTVTSGSQATITPVGNGWYRCSVFGVIASTSARVRIFIGDSPVSGYTGDGTSGILIWGAQVSDSASLDPYVYQPVAAPASTAYYGPRFDYDPVTLAPKGLLIEEQRTNLLTYSEQFDNAAWAKTATTVTANSTVAPDGTLTADTLIETTATSGHVISTSATVGAIANVLSVYLKKGLGATAPNWVQLYTGGVSAQYANFNLATVSVGSVAAGSTATITPTGNGWYRCTLTFTPSSAGSVAAVIAFTNNTDTATRGLSYAGAVTSDVFVWGAQLEAGAFATSYIPTVASQVTRAADSASMIGNNFARWYNPNAGTFSVGFSSQYSGNPGSTPTQLAFTNLSGASGFISYWNNAVVSSFDGTNAANANIGVSNWVGPHKVASAYGGTTKEICANAGTVGSSAYTGAWVAAAGLTFAPRGWISRTAFYGRKLSPAEQQGITS